MTDQQERLYPLTHLALSKIKPALNGTVLPLNKLLVRYKLPLIPKEHDSDRVRDLSMNWVESALTTKLLTVRAAQP